MSGPSYVNPNHVPTRFKIASQLGGFKDTVTLTDPFGTGARFTIHRNGSNAHRQWFKEQFDNNKLALVMAEAMLADPSVVLTGEEQKVVEAARADGSPSPLLEVIDRLVDITAEGRGRNAVMRQALRAGQLKPSEVTHQGFNDQLDEALFTLKGWDDLPGEDENGNPITVPYSLEAARELLTNDTPLEDCGLDDLILGVDAWRIEITPRQPEKRVITSVETDDITVVQEEAPPVYIMIPGLKLGRAYQLWILRRSHDTALFKSRLVEAAAKNSPASSETSSSSGDATNNEAPASS